MIAKLLQQIFGGIFQVALNLMGAIFAGFLGTPNAAVARVTVRQATPREVEGVHEVVLGAKPVAEEARRYWAAERNGMVIGAITAVHTEGGWEVRELVVLPEYDRGAVGTALVLCVHAALPGELWTSTELPGWPA